MFATGFLLLLRLDIGFDETPVIPIGWAVVAKSLATGAEVVAAILPCLDDERDMAGGGFDLLATGIRLGGGSSSVSEELKSSASIFGII